VALDAELLLGAGVGGLVGQDHAVREPLNEAGAKDRCRNSEDQVFDRYNIVSEADLREAMQRQSAYVDTLPRTGPATPVVA